MSYAIAICTLQPLLAGYKNSTSSRRALDKRSLVEPVSLCKP